MHLGADRVLRVENVDQGSAAQCTVQEDSRHTVEGGRMSGNQSEPAV